MLPPNSVDIFLFFTLFSRLPPYQCSAPESARGDNSISQKILTPSRNSLNHPAPRAGQSASSACYRPLLIGRCLSFMHSPDVRISHAKAMQKPCQKCKLHAEPARFSSPRRCRLAAAPKLPCLIAHQVIFLSSSQSSLSLSFPRVV